MYVVGLTGGIGSGKSTFAALLAERGARLVDADRLGREALHPGQPAWHSVVDQFGDEILVEGTMDIDRRRLAEIVFGDAGKLTALNAIVHPVILAGIADRLESYRGTDDVVVVDAALIVELGLDSSMDALVVLDASPRIRKQRLVRDRRMDPMDVEARMAAQMSRDELLSRADFVVQNDGTLEGLEREADRIWDELRKRAVR